MKSNVVALSFGANNMVEKRLLMILAVDVVHHKVEEVSFVFE